ncbi:MAG: DUF3570 domain-containing protein [Sandaracinus sp.]|nr:DUF3570 domain-containing protein [Sandaracinus sp.]MCB9621498.1 DUF3570 domain-containing protein [Sandaracinus sp.]
MTRTALTLACFALVACHAHVRDAASTLYVRHDTDRTTVTSPGVRASLGLGDRWQADGSYGVDVWTGASIDVRTAATRAIHETRHEAQLGARFEGTDVEVSGRYRLSYEPDYLSNGGSARIALDLAQKNTRLVLDVLGGRDRVGRSGDPDFARSLTRVGGRLTWSQILDPRTTLDVAYDLTFLSGFQSSAYRWVAIGGDGTCAGDAPFCVPENVPRERWRHAPSLHLRRALGDHFSAGLGYRFYVDSWSVLSSTVDADVAWVPSEQTTFSLAYRYYTQGEADFYRPRYGNFTETEGFWTRDRKLSAFYTHMLSLSWLRDFELDDATVVLGLRLTGTRFHYLAFVGLEHVHAMDATMSVGMRFR